MSSTENQENTLYRKACTAGAARGGADIDNGAAPGVGSGSTLINGCRKLSKKMAANHPAPTFPPLLKPGDRVGIAAPAGPFERERFDRGVAVLESMGFDVRLPGGLNAVEGYLAGSDDHRAAVFNALLADAEIKGIFCARGGYGSMRILERIDFEALRRRPKVFVGFSDITALHAAIFKSCALVTFHGPVVTSLAAADAETVAALHRAVIGDGPIRVSAPEARVLRAGRGRGMLAGGNLTTLCHLLGTVWAADFNGCILLLEDVGEAPYRIDRMLFQMKTAGCFEGLSGLVLGHFKNCGPPECIEAIVRRMTADLDIPVLSGLDVGHGRRNITLPLGKTVMLDTAAKTLDCERFFKAGPP